MNVSKIKNYPEDFSFMLDMKNDASQKRKKWLDQTHSSAMQEGSTSKRIFDLYFKQFFAI